ncbi:MAG: transporter associated domain-containing protein [Desulfuromonadaceae bacterium]
MNTTWRKRSWWRREKFDTVSGYLFNLLGHVPQVNEEIRDGDLCMTVVECDDRTIRKIRVRLVRDQVTPAEPAP